MNDREAFDNRRALVDQDAEIERLRAAVEAFTRPNTGFHATPQGEFGIDFEEPADAQRAFDALEALLASSASVQPEKG